MDEFLEPEKRKSKHIFRLYRRVFVLVFALAVLLQAVNFAQLQLKDYFTRLNDDFKVILTVAPEVAQDELTQMGESLSAKKDITSVNLFSPADALVTAHSGRRCIGRPSPVRKKSIMAMRTDKPLPCHSAYI